MKKWDLFMVFDVESVGLHGEGFAVGWVVVDRTGKELGAGRISCSPDRAGGPEEGRDWVAEHCPEMVHMCTGPDDVRRTFWKKWVQWRDLGAVLAADVPWPVEANFLSECVRSLYLAQGPYPVIDVASVRLAAGLDPLGSADRLPAELPAHDPLADARQSARLLVEALKSIDA